MGGRGSSSSGLPNPNRQQNPSQWDDLSLAAWMATHPDWIKPVVEGGTTGDMQKWLDKHPGWGQPQPKVNYLDGIGLNELDKLVRNAPDQEARYNILANWVDAHTQADKINYADEALPNEEQFWQVKVNGIEVRYTAVDDRLLDVVHILTTPGLIPPRLLEKVDTIELSMQTSKFDPEAIAGLTEGDLLSLKGSPLTLSDFSHEAAHELAHGLWDDGIPPQGSAYRAAIDSGEPPVSSYAHTSPAEDFAEAVGMYVENPRELKEIAPKRYRVIVKIMGSRSYGG